MAKRPKYEIAKISGAEIKVDVSLLAKTEEMFFNATQIASQFKKIVRNFLVIETTQEYIKEILEDHSNKLKHTEDIIKIKKGRYGGTWLHNELAFEFAGWCSAPFRRKLHKWTEKRIMQERSWRQERLEAKTGYRPLTNAIARKYYPTRFYHFSNEADLLNKIVLGMNARQFKETYAVENIRDALSKDELAVYTEMQMTDVGLINIGWDYIKRKEALKTCYEKIGKKKTKRIMA